MRSPFSLPVLLFFIALLGGLALLVQLGALAIAFQKLGLSPAGGLLLLGAALVGSGINIPLFRIESLQLEGNTAPWPGYRLLRPFPQPFQGRTIIAVNVGGCILPAILSVALFLSQPLGLWKMLLAIAVVTLASYVFSRPMPGMGIGMPILIAPLTAALVAGLLFPDHRGAAAYICGCLGVLIGADLLRLGDIRRLGTPLASIGGAGTFDGIFLTGIVAVLLA